MATARFTWIPFFVLVLAFLAQSGAAHGNNRNRNCTWNSRRCRKGQTCRRFRGFRRRCFDLKRPGQTCSSRFDICRGRAVRCEWKRGCRDQSWRRNRWRRRSNRRCPKICYKYRQLGQKCGKHYQICRLGTKCLKKGRRGLKRCRQLRNNGQLCKKRHQICRSGNKCRRKYNRGRGRGPPRCHKMRRPGTKCRWRGFELCMRGGKCWRLGRRGKYCVLLRRIGQSCSKWYQKCRKGGVCEKADAGGKKCVLPPSASPSESPSPVPELVPVTVTRTIGFQRSAPMIMRQITGDGVEKFIFPAGEAVVGQEAVVTVDTLQGDFDTAEKFLTLNVNNDGTNGVVLTGVGLETQCPVTPLAPTRPDNPSVSTTIIELEGGEIGVALTAIAEDTVGSCLVNGVTISVVSVVAPAVSPVARPLVF